MYTKREMYNVAIIVGDQNVFAHKVVLAMVSKMWRAEFGRSGMAESKSKELEAPEKTFSSVCQF